jgi:uncharacterized protein
MQRQFQPTLDDKVAFLRNPKSYPDRPFEVEAIETHFAWVFLTSRYAYKLKKPLRQSFMDYRTLAARKRGCRAEMRLNRRLAPRVYLSAVPLSIDRSGALKLGKGLQVADWLVKMRRLPSARMLDHTLARRAPSAAEISQLIAHLAKFFRRAQRHAVKDAAYSARLRRQVTANRRALKRFGARLRQPLAASVATTQLEFIQGARAALGARGAHVVEGHGDLRPEHVCLGPPLAVIDCLEFDRDLRLLDPAEEMTFLALEVERMGAMHLAWEVLQRFCAASGDPVPAAVLHFYMSHRAATRAKLAAWHMDDPQFADVRPWIARTHSYLRDALRHALRAVRLARSAALPARGRPALEQGRKRHAAQHARHGLPKERGDRQDRERVSV